MFQYLLVTGIAFNLILIRIARHRVHDTTTIISMLRPINVAGVHSNTNRKKPAARQSEVDTISAIAFRPGHEGSGSVVHDHISTTASVV